MKEKWIICKAEGKIDEDCKKKGLMMGVSNLIEECNFEELISFDDFETAENALGEYAKDDYIEVKGTDIFIKEHFMILKETYENGKTFNSFFYSNSIDNVIKEKIFSALIKIIKEGGDLSDRKKVVKKFIYDGILGFRVHTLYRDFIIESIIKMGY